MKTVMYSAVFGGISDDVERLMASAQPAHPELLCILFTDRLAPGEYRRGGLVWKVLPPRYSHLDPRRMSRFHKINSHVVLPPHDASVWIDGAMSVRPGADLVATARGSLRQGHIATFRHPARTCVYQELQACLRLRKDDPGTMRRQVARYRAEGYPAFAGMVETALVVRDCSAAVRRFNARWWGELAGGSLRDQLSFNYVAWKLRQPYVAIPGCRDSSALLEFRPHR